MSNLENGIKAENMIAEKLLFRNQDLEQNHTWGIDIILNRKNKRIKIEVKSSQLFVKRYKGVRSGKFSIRLNDLERAIDYFAFVIYKPNEKVDTYWVRGEVVRKHFERRIRNKTLGLGIPTLLTRIPKVDFSEVIEL